MKDNLDKHIEKLVDKAMKHSLLESPSKDFTANVMSQVSAISETSVTAYKPLISKKIWFVVLVVLAASVIFILMGNIESAGWFNSINFNLLSDYKINNIFSNLRVSKTVVYSVVLFSIMISIQVLVLKNYFDKRLEV